MSDKKEYISELEVLNGQLEEELSKSMKTEHRLRVFELRISIYRLLLEDRLTKSSGGVTSGRLTGAY